MLRTLEEVISAAEALDRRSQYELAETLVRKLGESAEHKALWAREAARRNELFENGETSASPVDEVVARVRKSIGH